MTEAALMLQQNKKWQDPGWQYPRARPSEYALDYADRVRSMNNVRGVWALVRGSVLDIYTLIEADRETERQLHSLELDLQKKWEDAPVRFHVTFDQEVLQEQLAGEEPILTAS